MISLLNCGFFSYPKELERGNQDSYLLPKAIGEGFAFAVADGVGSYLGAKEAADIATSYIGSVEAEEVTNVRAIMSAIKTKIDEMTEGRQELLKAATTFSYCYIDDTNLHIGHVGDSRIYIKKSNKLVLLTKDHTQHQELLDDGIYSKKELRNLPGKNVLTSALSRHLTLRFQEIKLPINELIDEYGVVNLYVMSDGAHHFWEKRPRLSVGSLMVPTRFASSLLRRIESNEALDDYTLVAASFSVIN